MSDSFYDRTTGNISGINALASLNSVYPAFGSRVSFSSRANTYETSNGYYSSIPMSLNNLSAKFELRYDLPEQTSQQLVKFLEEKKGQDFIEFNDPSSFYKRLSGVCDNYAVNHINKRGSCYCNFQNTCIDHSPCNKSNGGPNAAAKIIGTCDRRCIRHE